MADNSWGLNEVIPKKYDIQISYQIQTTTKEVQIEVEEMGSYRGL